MPLLVRHLGVVDFGQYTLVLSIIAMVQGLTEGGLQAIGVREYSVLSKAERDLMMRRLLALRVLATGGGVGLARAVCGVAGYDSHIVLGTLVGGSDQRPWSDRGQRERPRDRRDPGRDVGERQGYRPAAAAR